MLGSFWAVPQEGRLRFATELGVIEVQPQEIAVIPRGVRFRVELLDDSARGYLCENFGAPLRLPDLGPIGSNGLANPRDFQVPVAAYEDPGKDQEFIRFNTLCTLYEDPVTHESVQLLSVALPIGYQQLRAFEPGNLRKFIATTLVETLKKAQIPTPKTFDYSAFVNQIERALDLSR